MIYDLRILQLQIQITNKLNFEDIGLFRKVPIIMMLMHLSYNQIIIIKFKLIMKMICLMYHLIYHGIGFSCNFYAQLQSMEAIEYAKLVHTPYLASFMIKPCKMQVLRMIFNAYFHSILKVMMKCYLIIYYLRIMILSI